MVLNEYNVYNAFRMVVVSYKPKFVTTIYVLLSIVDSHVQKEFFWGSRFFSNFIR